MIDEQTDPVMQARLAKLFSHLAEELRRKNQELYPKRRREALVPEPTEAPTKAFPVLSDEAKAIFLKATNPPETLDEVKECLR